MKKLLLLIAVFTFSFGNAQTGMLNGTGYAPDITVTDLNGNSHNLYSYLNSGKIVVLELFSTTCGHCQQYAAGTENAYQIYGPSGMDVAEFIGLEVNSSSSNIDVANFATTYGVGFPLCNDISVTAINYQLYYTPSYYVVFPDSTYETFCPYYCQQISSSSTIETLISTAIQSWIPPVYGCTDPIAVNYNPLANTDDSTCVFNFCNEDSPSGLNVSSLIHDRVTINWDNMNSIPSTPTSHIINAGNYYYAPQSLTINQGDTVTWINDGGYHNVNFDINTISSNSFNNPHSFVSSPTSNTTIYTHVFNVSGSYQYDCSVGSHANNGMVGAIQVNSSSPNTPICIVDQYRIRYREIGINSWSTKTIGAPVGSCNNPALNTSKLILNLTPSTNFEYQMKAWYCSGGTSSWTSVYNFTTDNICNNVINVSVNPISNTKTEFCWDSVTTYSFVRLKYRQDIPGSSFNSIGGFGVFSPTLCKDKNGLNPGTDYRVMWRTWCSSTGGPYRSPVWGGPVLWTQSTSIRIVNTVTEERKLVKITDLLGREVHPEKVIDNTTLFYIYSDGTLEKRIVIE